MRREFDAVAGDAVAIHELEALGVEVDEVGVAVGKRRGAQLTTASQTKVDASLGRAAGLGHEVRIAHQRMADREEAWRLPYREQNSSAALPYGFGYGGIGLGPNPSLSFSTTTPNGINNVGRYGGVYGTGLGERSRISLILW